MEETIYDPRNFLHLPYELQQKIALDLDVQSVLNLCNASQFQNSIICKDDVFWKRKYQKDFRFKKLYPEKSWFENYKLSITGLFDFEIGHRLLDHKGWEGETINSIIGKIAGKPIFNIDFFEITLMGNLVRPVSDYTPNMIISEKLSLKFGHFLEFVDEEGWLLISNVEESFINLTSVEALKLVTLLLEHFTLES